MNQHEYFIGETIELAEAKMKEGHGGPFAAIVVKNNEIVGTGYNCVTSTNDPTAHAEVQAIRDACKKLDTFQLTGCILYSSCEPCPMCLGAIYWARPDAVYFAASKDDAANAGFDDSFIYDELNIPMNERKILMKKIEHSEKNRPFEEWIKLENKIDY